MNRLKNEKSEYLLQHADNPVDWYPWSKEAFDTMQVDPPSWLQSSISRLDTIVRDQIPQNLYNWIIGQR